MTTALTGNLALLGIQARNGVEFAVDEINASGGIAGKKLVLTTEDTGASSTDALNAMNRIIESKPLIIFGSMISPHVFAQTEGVAPLIEDLVIVSTGDDVEAQIAAMDNMIALGDFNMPKPRRDGGNIVYDALTSRGLVTPPHSTVVGSSIAIGLQRVGIEVTVIDAAPSADAASWGNAGHIAIAVFIKESKEPVEKRERVIAEIARAAHDYFLFVKAR